MSADPRFGDIILCRRHDLAGTIVRIKTSGFWDHAAFVIDRKTVFDAMGSGVKYRTIDHCYAHGWLHLRFCAMLTPTQQEAMSAWCLAHDGWGYDWLGCIGIGFGCDMAQPGRLFCSELIEKVYLAAGLYLVARRKVGLVTPDMLSCSTLLKTVATNEPSLTEIFDKANRQNTHKQSGDLHE